MTDYASPPFISVSEQVIFLQVIDLIALKVTTFFLLLNNI